MDILLALTTGAAIFSYFVPTVEAYNPEEQQGMDALSLSLTVTDTADSSRGWQTTCTAAAPLTSRRSNVRWLSKADTAPYCG